MQKIPPNMTLLSNAIDQTGPWQRQKIQVKKSWLIEEMRNKIQDIDWKSTTNDVRRFIKPNEQQALSLWNSAFFLSRLEKMKEYL